MKVRSHAGTLDVARSSAYRMASVLRATSVLVFLLFADVARADVVGEGESAPAFVLKTLNATQSGTTSFSLRKALQSDARAIVLTFSASYCEPCLKELHELEEASPTLRSRGLLVASIGVDTDDEGIRKLAQLVEKLAIPVLSDRYGIVARKYRVDSLPTLVAVGKDGNVLASRVGYEPGSAEKFIKDLRLQRSAP